MPFDLFISHTTEDDPLADRLYDALTAAGLRVWVDHREGIQYGDLWEQKIRYAIGEAAKGLFLMSRRSLASAYCEAEWNRILELGKPLYVALLEPLARNDLPLLISRIQYADLTQPATFESTLHKLINALRGEPTATDAPTAAQYTRLTTENGIDRRLTTVPLIGRESDLADVRQYLKAGYPTFLLGVGGTGKSRLAAELALHGLDGDHGCVWHVCTDTSVAEMLKDLLRQHYALPPETQFRDVLKHLSEQRCLVVIDNAESLDESRLKDYQSCVEQLIQHKVPVLITSRVAWIGLQRTKQHTPSALTLPAAAQIAREIARVEQVSLTDADSERVAAAARLHPRLIEWSVMQLSALPLERLLRQLDDLRGQGIQEALDEMIHKTLTQMIAAEPNGEQAAALLKRLNTCRGGFTYAAALALHPEQDEDALDALLGSLLKWRFLSYEGERQRYSVYPLVSEAVGEDVEAYTTHSSYYQTLVDRHNKRQDYAGIADEVENLIIAFARLHERNVPAAYWFANACCDFFLNQGRVRLWVAWIKRCAADLAEAEDNDLRGAFQTSLGNAYGHLAALEDRAGNLERAIQAYQEALHFRTPESAPHGYAMIQNNLGNIYSDLATFKDRANNIRWAINAYQEALRFWTPESASHGYAMIQNNLGATYRALADLEDRMGNLRRAITACQEALRFWTSKSAPLGYAMIQNNLGNTYGDLAMSEDQVGNLRRAINAYQEALHFRTPESAPLRYATTQNNLGAAYRTLADLEDRAGNLERAVAAYQEALRFRTPASAPLDYAMTQHNLGITYEALGDLAAACACWREAERYYRHMGAREQADHVRGWLQAQCGA